MKEQCLLVTAAKMACRLMIKAKNVKMFRHKQRAVKCTRIILMNQNAYIVSLGEILLDQEMPMSCTAVHNYATLALF